MLSEIGLSTLPVVEADVRYGAPVVGVRKFIAVGLNYSDHAEEAGMAIPKEPIIFTKAITCISGPNDDIVQPPHSTKLDWELGAFIGTEARYVSEADALKHVAGYCVINDISVRAFQLQSSQWDKGKGCDTFGPIGPWLVTRDEVAGPQNLNMWLDVNGERRQAGNSKNHDLYSIGDHLLLESLHHTATWRRYLHRYASRCWHGNETSAALPEPW